MIFRNKEKGFHLGTANQGQLMIGNGWGPYGQKIDPDGKNQCIAKKLTAPDGLVSHHLFSSMILVPPGKWVCDRNFSGWDWVGRRKEVGVFFCLISFLRQNIPKVFADTDKYK